MRIYHGISTTRSARFNRWNFHILPSLYVFRDDVFSDEKRHGVVFAGLMFEVFIYIVTKKSEL